MSCNASLYLPVSFLALFFLGCQTPDRAARLHDNAGPQLCRIADPSTVDGSLLKHATSVLTNEKGDEVWTLLAETDGLVSYSETFDVLRANTVGTLFYRKEGPTISAVLKNLVLTSDQLQSFKDRVAKADQLCDLDNPSFGGTRFFYLHLKKEEGGSVKTFGAFVAPNPEGSVPGAEHADIVKVFNDLAAHLNL